VNDQVFALGRSTVSTGAESKVHGRNLPVVVRGIQIDPVSRATSILVLRELRLTFSGRYHIL
jgi:hypothetical protein